MPNADFSRLPQILKRQRTLAARFASGTQRIVATTGHDERRIVAVHLTEGGSISEIRVGSGWANLGWSAADLSRAVMSAYGEGVGNRLAGWAEGVAEPRDEELEAAAPDSSTESEENDFTTRFLRALGTSVQDPEGMERLLALTNRWLDHLDAATARVEATATTEFKDTSRSRHVSAVVTGNGQLASVTFDPQWLEHAHSVNLGREATQAVQAATQRATTASIETVQALALLADATRAASNPEELARMMRDVGSSGSHTNQGATR